MLISFSIHFIKPYQLRAVVRYVRFIFCSVLLLFCAVHAVSGQTLVFPSSHERYVVKTLNIEDGLLNNTVNDIITDTFGFAWVATKTGLQRYNGYRLETIHPNVNGKTLTFDYQVYFFQTRQHFLWVTCKEGVLQYNPFTDNFTLLVSLPSAEALLRPFAETEEGIWCAREKKLSLYSPDGRLIKEFLYPDTITCPVVSGFCNGSNSRFLFLSTSQNHLLLFDKKSHAFSFLPVHPEGLLKFSNTETRVYLLHRNGITVCEEKNGVYTEAGNFLFARRYITSGIKVFRDGILASFDEHLFFIDSTCRHVTEITTLNSQPLLRVGGMKSFYEDHLGRLWVLATNEVKLILNYIIPFRYYAYTNTTNYTKSVYEDEKRHVVLVGQYSAGLQMYDTLGNPLWKEPVLTDKVKDIAGIEKLDADDYLVTAIEQGLYIFHLPQKKFTPVILSAGEEAKLQTHGIIWTNNIERRDSSHILFTTRTNVIEASFDRNYRMHARLLFHDPVSQVFCFYLNKKNNHLWIGTMSGTLYKRYGDRTDTIITPGKYQIRCLVPDSNNNIWVGTDKGLFVYNENNTLIRSFTTSNGLLNDCIYSLLADKDDHTMYAATNLGLSVVRLSGVLKNFTKERGLQENEFNSAATAKTSTGKLYFGGVNGVTSFYPSDIMAENDRPTLIIYKTDINDKPFRSDSAVWTHREYKLHHNQSKISFSLAAFGIYPASDYTYEYRMKGFDKSWTTTNNPVNISYHLPPGTYAFEVRLVNFPSLLISRTLIIASPFWETWWFYLLLFAVVVLVVMLAVRSLYQRRYKVQLQQLQIRQQVLAERERISRDLHDNIGAYASAISANVDEVIYGNEKYNPAVLQKLKESAREIIVQLRDSIWALNKETQSVIMLSDRIKNYIQKLQPAYPSISFDVEEDIEQNATFPSITALHVLRIVQEAVHNAIKHSGCSFIQVSISSRSPVMISVADNGRGMPLSPVYGDGVKNMQMRAADIGWRVNILSKAGGCTVRLTDTTS